MIGDWSVRRRLAPSLYVVLGLLLISVLIWRSGPQQILDAFREVDPTWVLSSALLLTASTLIGAANVYFLVDHLNRPRLGRFLRIYWLSWAIGLVVPGQVGDMATLGLSFRKHGMSLSFTVGRALVDKLISLLVMMIIAILGLASILDRVAVEVSLYAESAALLVAFLCLLLWGARKHTAALFRIDKPGLAGGIGRTFREVGYVARQMPGKIVVNAVLTCMKLWLTGCAYWTMLAAFGYELRPWWDVVALSTLAGLVAYIPVSFNGYGTVEAAAIVLFGQLGVPAATVLVTYLCLRILVLVLAWLPSLILAPFARERATTSL